MAPPGIRLCKIESVSFASLPVIFRGFPGPSRDFPSPQNRIRLLHIPSRYFSSFPGTLSRLPGPAKSIWPTSCYFVPFFKASGCLHASFVRLHSASGRFSMLREAFTLHLSDFTQLPAVFRRFGCPSRRFGMHLHLFRPFFRASGQPFISSGRLLGPFGQIHTRSGRFSVVRDRILPRRDLFRPVGKSFHSSGTPFRLIGTLSHSFRTLPGRSGNHFTRSTRLLKKKSSINLKEPSGGSISFLSSDSSPYKGRQGSE